MRRVIKLFFFILVCIEIIAIYSALSGEYLDTLVKLLDCTLNAVGWSFSVGGIIKALFRWSPFLFPASFFFKVSRGVGEETLRFFRVIYDAVSTIQVVVIFFCLGVALYYINKFYTFFSNRVSNILSDNNCTKS